MAPLLLDHRSMFRAGLYIGLCGILIFFGGYYTGYQKAAQNGDIAMSRTMALALPGVALADTSEFEPQVPVSIAPGADIDVDSPDTEIVANSHTLNIDEDTFARVAVVANAEEPGSKSTGQDTAVTSLNNVSDAVDKIASDTNDKPALQLASLKVTPVVIESNHEVSTEQNPVIDTADATTARYTIQVGMYADMGNAERRVSELELQQLSAYIDSYTNKQNKERFNVRFGYFDSMSSAREALAIYEKQFDGSGYIASMRRN